MKTSQGKIGALLITTALACSLWSVSWAQGPVSANIPRIVYSDARPKSPLKSSKKSSRTRAGSAKAVRSRAKDSKKSSNNRIEFAKRSWAFPSPPPIVHFGGGTFEKSIAVDPRISVSLCVTQGDVKINGWSRNEVRVFVKDGSKIGFDIVQAGRPGAKPVWIKVVGSDPKKPAASKECLWGGVVELDVPTGASVDLEGKETATAVDTIRKVKVKNVGGNISIRNVTEGVNALTYEGNVDVENSDGTIMLESSSGNILVFESAPSQVGDTFRAKTSGGTISLQHLEHRQVDVSSISGTILVNSELLAAGIYNIGTSNGSIILGLPSVPPCFLIATYGFGRFDSEIPVKIIQDDNSPGPIKSIKAMFGDLEKRDCRLKLTSSSGNIRIRKQ